MANHLISGLFSGLSLRALARAMGRVPTNELTATESASTLFRFFRQVELKFLAQFGLPLGSTGQTEQFAYEPSHCVDILRSFL